MEPVDLIALAKSSNGARNTHLARTSILPPCVQKFVIEKGPSLPAICAGPGNTVPHELAKTFALPGSDKPQIEDHIPLQFTLVSNKERRDGCWTFPVGVFVRSIDFEPDLAQAHQALYGHPAGTNAHMYFPPDAIVIRGWFYSLQKTDEVPKDLRKQEVRECIIVYEPRRGEGCLGEVTTVQELPVSGVIKNLDVFYRIMQKSYIGCFVESHSPDGVTRFGRISGSCYADLALDALRRCADEWEYRSLNDSILLCIFAAEFKDGALEFDGDAFLCSDGTMLLTYYYSPVLLEGRNPPSTWIEGYYSHRIYPRNSGRVPAHILRSFEAQMPAWFLKNEAATKVA